jgi:hypothetical protein
MNYADKLKDPRWQKKRLEILERDSFRCQGCGNKKQMLVVHHRHYDSDKDPWDYADNILVTLCDDCHKLEHTVDIAINDINTGLTNSQTVNLLHAVAGIHFTRGIPIATILDLLVWLKSSAPGRPSVAESLLAIWDEHSWIQDENNEEATLV